jgi:NADP-dependent 3-hydroxy acid dehydrogenase YdfG
MMSTAQFQGKIVVITGASSGIGRATALAFAGQGATVVLAARHREALQEVQRAAQARGVQTLVVPTDVAQREQVRRLVQQALDRFGTIDVFIANAGMYLRCPVRALTLAEVERVMAVDFYGAVSGILEVLPHMLNRGSGHIVAVSSMDGKKGIPPDGAYVAAKFALTGFLEVLRQELHGTGVHVSTIFPGRTNTPMIANLRVPVVSAKIPPEQVAGAILRAVQRRQAEVLVPYLGAKALLLLNSVSCGLGDWAVRVFQVAGQEMHLSRDAGSDPGRTRAG